MSKKPLQGIKVLDLTTNIAGPSTAGLLSDFGCDVIKIERPKVGDDARGFGPFVNQTSLLNLFVNRGKRSLALPLRDKESIEIIYKLIEKADVIIQSFKPGVMDKLGLGYETVSKINPRIIYASISLYGHNSKYSSQGGYDMIAQARSGIMSMNGYPDQAPVKTGVTIADDLAALNAYAGIVTALYNRMITGEGQHVDIGLFNVLFAINDYVEMAAHGFNLIRAGDHHESLNPYGVFHSKAGSLIILAISANLWKSLCMVMGREDLINHPDYFSNAKRLERREAVNDIVTNWLNTFDDIETPEKLLVEQGIPCGKVFNHTEAIAHVYDAEVDMLAEVPAPSTMKVETCTIRKNAMKLSKTPGDPISAAPVVGEHNEEILQELGYDNATIKRLIEKWNS